jgi:hypothetical protein
LRTVFKDQGELELPPVTASASIADPDKSNLQGGGGKIKR